MPASQRESTGYPSSKEYIIPSERFLILLWRAGCSRENHDIKLLPCRVHRRLAISGSSTVLESCGDTRASPISMLLLRDLAIIRCESTPKVPHLQSIRDRTLQAGRRVARRANKLIKIAPGAHVLSVLEVRHVGSLVRSAS